MQISNATSVLYVCVFVCLTYHIYSNCKTHNIHAAASAPNWRRNAAHAAKSARARASNCDDLSCNGTVRGNGSVAVNWIKMRTFSH